MSKRNAIAHILIAVLVGATAGPALAKKQGADAAASAQAQQQGNKSPSARRGRTPPSMLQPAFHEPRALQEELPQTEPMT